ncbi:MAG: MarR family transcriptional regulator [Thermoplasmata archaeon]|nr:MarR family transcriptional regulator [Thermoplasmata archaeon]
MLEKFGELTKMDPESLTCLDVVKCLHNLTDTDIRVLDNLPRTGGITAARIGEAIGKDRSTAHRSLEKLVSSGVCYKEKQPGSPRGYSYRYRRVSIKEIFKKAEQNLDVCYAKVKEALKKADDMD